MLTFRSFGAAAVLAAALAMPAFAQTPPKPATTPPAAGAAPTTMPAPATTAATPAPAPAPAATTAPMPAKNTAMKGPTGTLHKVHGMWRSTNLVGATVYNNSGQSIGTIEKLLIRSKGKVSQAVISVGGFLGIGSKLVEVSFNQLKFKPSVNNRTAPMITNTATTPPASTAPAATATNASARPPKVRVNYSVVLPGSTKATLTKMPAFTYYRHNGA
jgi:sporulation protein YlmC with PRC-barrel domain